MLTLLRQRNFALLWLGGLISLAGDWVLTAALPFFVYQVSGSTLASALMAAAGLLPRFLLGSLAGVFVDRWNRQRIMALTSLGQAGLILPLLLVHSRSDLWIVYLVSFLRTGLAIFFGPAENALLPTLVAEDQLLPANSLNAMNNNLARLFGPPLGGMLLAMAGLPGVVLFDSLTFLVAAGLISRMHPPARPPAGAPGAQAYPEPRPPHTSFWARFRKEWSQGMSIVRRERGVRLLFISVILLNLGGVVMSTLGAAYIVQIVQASSEQYGWLMTAQAIGGILGGLLAARLGRRRSPAQLYGWAEVVLGGVLVLRYNIPYLPSVFVTSLLVGLPAALGAAALDTLFQQKVPNAYLGRISGALDASMSVVSLLGVLGLSGALGEVLGITPVINLAIAITALNGVLAMVWFRGE